MTISLIRPTVVLAVVTALAMFIVVTPVQSADGPFDELAAQHEDLQDAIADLQESVDALGQLTPPCGAGTAGERFVLLDGGEEVCDNTTGLIWDQMPDSADSVTRTLQQALDHCPTLGAGSRLPEIKELLSLLDYSQFDPALPAGHPFINDTNFSQGNYWSVTGIAAGDPIGAWTMGLHEGETGPRIGSAFRSTWCVRDGP